ncbi:MAG: hypothetical protein JJ938_01010 [Roseicyclus sp.]|nr:hypothetical protein [Roseicyclus sp.]MBO6623425.1 hypothetical protein [Roseicyclus sp.]MBO6920761.1 hypothetical protein [Roseicyclus sp.]
METYIVVYDLHKHGQNYECVHKKLRDYGSYCHLQGSVWLVRSQSSAVQVRDNLQSCLDQNDKIYVAALTGEAAWKGHTAEISSWIKTKA